jgi:outer membrane protein OmpA-like peptidoglycan-associated protein
MKRLVSIKGIFIGIPAAGLLLLWCAGGFMAMAETPDDDLKEALFKDATFAMETAKQANADLYSPEAFEAGMKLYRDAEKKFESGGNIEEIRKKLDQALGFFNKAMEGLKLSNVVMKDAQAARDDALKAEADKYAAEDWKKAEQLFEKAAQILERGNSKKAGAKSAEAEQAYRAAELNAIKVNYLQGAWSLIEKADDMGAEEYAPKTLAKARSLAESSEKLLTEDRYDTDKARQEAQQAKYEASHAIFLTDTIKELRTSVSPFNDDEVLEENMLLEAERPLHLIAGALEMVARFDEGSAAPTSEMMKAIGELKEENSRLGQELIDKNAEISALGEQVALMEQRLDESSAEEEALKKKIEQQKIRREKITRIDNSFTRDEGNALLDNQNIVISLYGLNFASGRSNIESENFGLLKKVIKAFKEFPGCKIIIEGHTDSRGGDERNLRLSEERAEAVKQYILANTGISPSRIHAVGYGESRPVANNEIEEGRAKNRRIDVVIMPAPL